MLRDRLRSLAVDCLAAVSRWSYAASKCLHAWSVALYNARRRQWERLPADERERRNRRFARREAKARRAALRAYMDGR